MDGDIYSCINPKLKSFCIVSHFLYSIYVSFYLLHITRTADNPESQKYEEANCVSVLVTSFCYST